VNTGIDLAALIDIGKWAAQALGRQSDSFVTKAGPSRDLIRELPTGQIANQTKK